MILVFQKIRGLLIYGNEDFFDCRSFFQLLGLIAVHGRFAAAEFQFLLCIEGS